ncbi:MAG: hypothetical protein HZB62_03885 [Nitrospirae bacterium]|nr:hypothetical protein [Nitrospirota bacterium]
MDKEELPDRLCAGYCSFYKPGKDEELACRGFIIIEKLLRQGKELPAVTEKTVMSMRSENDLFQLVCGGCPFFKEDCDFAAWKRGEGRDMTRKAVNPCGGLLCLGHCIEKGTVDIEDINRVI